MLSLKKRGLGETPQNGQFFLLSEKKKKMNRKEMNEGKKREGRDEREKKKPEGREAKKKREAETGIEPSLTLKDPAVPAFPPYTAR